MSKINLTALFCLISFFSFSQKTISYTIAEIKACGITLNRNVGYDSSNVPIDTIYFLIGRDNRYSQLFEYISLKTGSIQSIYDLLKKSYDFVNAELPGTSTIYKHNYLSVEKVMGVNTKYIDIYASNEKGSKGYTGIDAYRIKKLMTLIEGYCSRKSIKL